MRRSVYGPGHDVCHSLPPRRAHRRRRLLRRPGARRVLAERGHDLALTNPEEGLVAELEGLGAAVEVIDAPRDLADPATSEALVAGTLARFGRMDAGPRSPVRS